MIQISQKCIDEIRQHGERDFPYECCGLLIGKFESDSNKIVIETYGISNAREEEAKRNRFLIQPEELIEGEKYAREQQLDVIGFYHSHPDSPAVPSRYDLEHAWPMYSYIIVATTKDGSGDLRSWEQRSDRSQFDEEVLDIRG